MEAGPQLDALIAPLLGHIVKRDDQGAYIVDGDTGHKWPVPHYSTDMVFAWRVWDRVAREGWRLIKTRGGYTVRGVGQLHVDVLLAEATTAPHAICLAAISPNYCLL